MKVKTGRKDKRKALYRDEKGGEKSHQKLQYFNLKESSPAVKT